MAPRKTRDQQRQEQTITESEDPTELGLVWPEPVVEHVTDQASNPWWPEDTLGGVDAVEEPSNGKEVMEESPRLSDYEGEGFIARRKERTTPQKFSDGFKLPNLARKKEKYNVLLARAKADFEAKDKIYREAVVELATAQDESINPTMTEEATSDDDDDNVPIVALVRKAPSKKSAKQQ